jgi:hypothetical protein
MMMNKNPTLFFGVAGAALLALGLLFAMTASRRRRRRFEYGSSNHHNYHNTQSIFAYLQDFEVEDIDLRKSPPGGWHGTYLHKLAYGINRATDLHQSEYKYEYEADPLTTIPMGRAPSSSSNRVMEDGSSLFITDPSGSSPAFGGGSSRRLDETI